MRNEKLFHSFTLGLYGNMLYHARRRFSKHLLAYTITGISFCLALIELHYVTGNTSLRWWAEVFGWIFITGLLVLIFKSSKPVSDIEGKYDNINMYNYYTPNPTVVSVDVAKVKVYAEAVTLQFLDILANKEVVGCWADETDSVITLTYKDAESGKPVGVGFVQHRYVMELKELVEGALHDMEEGAIL